MKWSRNKKAAETKKKKNSEMDKTQVEKSSSLK